MYKHVGIWIRVLTEEQVQGDSPEHHERRARHYAEAKDWNVAEVYQLEAVSGKAVMALSRLSIKRTWDTIVVWSTNVEITHG